MLMIYTFEPVCDEIETLFINKLPDYIEKINKQYNDGIVLKRFENRNLNAESIKQPCFFFDYMTATLEPKDRIIENEIFILAFDIKLQEKGKLKTKIFWRYLEAMQLMFKEEETTFPYKISEINKNKIIIHVTISL